MTSVNVPDGMTEWTDGTGCSVDIATRADIGPYRTSRLHAAYVSDRMTE